jgi:hypothetical protein
LSLTIAADAFAECAKTVPIAAAAVDRDHPIRMFTAVGQSPHPNRLARHA